MSSIDLHGVSTAVSAIAGADAAVLPDAQIVEELAALRRLADVAEAAYLARLDTFDKRGLAEVEVLSTRAWAAHHLHVAPAATTRTLKVAKGLRRLPLVAEALASGSIGMAHAAAIVDAVSMLGHEVVAEAEAALVAAAQADEPTRLRAALRGYGAAVDSPSAVKRAERRAEGRWLDVSTTLDGAVAIQGMLGEEAGAMLRAALEPFTAPAGADDTRSATQRRADALVELARRALDTGDLPDHAGERPHVTVITDLATLESRAGGSGELPDGTVLRGETVRRIGCDAMITRIVIGPDSVPLDVGRTQRTVTPAQRKALRVRDRRCRFPGCRRPFAWTDAHHVRYWAHGGGTNLDNLVLLCRAHHTSVHEHHWSIHPLAPGRFLFVNPAGHAVIDDGPSTTTEIIDRIVTVTDQARAGPADGGWHIDT